ncbi:MAG: hypothetical protein JNK07_12900 [Alphaproteobacteria bacterium]|nr:hypothetical protein [Alphaproteobacteria bacterium]
MFDDIGFEILKALIGPVVAVGLAWLVGNRLSTEWALRQRRREQSLASVAEFYRLYGEFFALWKLCNYAFRDADHETDDATLWDLMRRSAALEANGEAILLRIASEVTLSKDDIRTLGLFRQGVQLLRQSIVKQRILGWSSSEHREYQAFKGLSVGVGSLAAKVGSVKPPSLETAQQQLRDVTHNKWSKEWIATIARRDEIPVQAELEALPAK